MNVNRINEHTKEIIKGLCGGFVGYCLSLGLSVVWVRVSFWVSMFELWGIYSCDYGLEFVEVCMMYARVCVCASVLCVCLFCVCVCVCVCCVCMCLCACCVFSLAVSAVWVCCVCVCLLCVCVCVCCGCVCVCAEDMFNPNYSLWCRRFVRPK